ncbi:MAG: hypothetical protein WAW86_02860 [Gammaproteobacteria bacterium]
MDSRNLELTYDAAYQELKTACRLLNAEKPCSEKHFDTLTSDYQKLIEQFKLLPEAYPFHYRQLSQLSFNLAIYLFNLGSFLGAANFYLCTIQWLEHIECSTQDLRELIKRSLDLAECYIYLARKDLALKAINFAVKTFTHIPAMEKHDKEIIIGDPMINFAEFYNHYQALSSTPKHFKSTQFKNSGSLINLMIEAKNLDTLRKELSLITTSEEEEKELSSMLEEITLQHEDILTLNISKLDSTSLDDEKIRIQIGEYLKLALQHRDAGSTKRQLETYDQILQSYSMMIHKTPADLGVIRSITEDKEKRQRQSQPATFFSRPSSPMASSSSSSNRMDMS